jgi:1-acyl-sn-glycerol-3-phosphate acyltransferase
MTAFVLSTLGLYSIWFIGNPFVSNKLRWRQTAFYAWTKSFAVISSMQTKVIGTAPEPPFFLVSNHLSYVDIAALRIVVKGVFVAKNEINDWFLAGRIVRDMGTIFIDRSNRRDIPQAGEKIIERLDAGEGVIIFPEGTSTKGEDVKPFHSSFLEFAARKQIPVSYVSVSYSTPPGETPANIAVCWWQDISFFAHIWQLFHVREYTATIVFGDQPVQSSDRKQLAAELRQLVEKTFTPVG